MSNAMIKINKFIFGSNTDVHRLDDNFNGLYVNADVNPCVVIFSFRFKVFPKINQPAINACERELLVMHALTI